MKTREWFQCLLLLLAAGGGACLLGGARCTAFVAFWNVQHIVGTDHIMSMGMVLMNIIYCSIFVTAVEVHSVYLSGLHNHSISNTASRTSQALNGGSNTATPHQQTGPPLLQLSRTVGENEVVYDDVESEIVQEFNYPIFPLPIQAGLDQISYPIFDFDRFSHGGVKWLQVYLDIETAAVCPKPILQWQQADGSLHRLPRPLQIDSTVEYSLAFTVTEQRPSYAGRVVLTVFRGLPKCESMLRRWKNVVHPVSGTEYEKADPLPLPTLLLGLAPSCTLVLSRERMELPVDERETPFAILIPDN